MNEALAMIRCGGTMQPRFDRLDACSRDELGSQKTQNAPTSAFARSSSVEEEKSSNCSIISDEKWQAARRSSPDVLPTDAEWCTLNLDDPSVLLELSDFLSTHYSSISPDLKVLCSPEFLSWALKPPGWKKEWHIGIRSKTLDWTSNGEQQATLIGFISAVPGGVAAGPARFRLFEINMLAVHGEFRGYNFGPALVKEIMRRCALSGIYQTVYTATKNRSASVGVIRTYYRVLNGCHSQTLQTLGVKLPPPVMHEKAIGITTRECLGTIRAMCFADLPAVRNLLCRYLQRFPLSKQFASDEEAAHWLGAASNNNFMRHFVVLSANNVITDFVSYYILQANKSGRGSENNTKIGYLYYYATEAAFPAGEPSTLTGSSISLERRLQNLVNHLTNILREDGVHVLCIRDILDNHSFIHACSFTHAQEPLHIYLPYWDSADLMRDQEAASLFASSIAVHLPWI